MKEKTFQGIVNAVPVVIILVSILLPFSANGWDIGRTVIPANPFLPPGSGLMPGPGFLEGLTASGTLAGEGPMISVKGSGVTEDGTRFYLEVTLRNPMPMEIEVRRFSARAPVGGSEVDLAMERPVAIPPGGSVDVKLEGPVVKGSSLQGRPAPSVSDLSTLSMTIVSGGIEMTLDEDAIRGMLS